MRKCPKCNKTYDDSWKICLLCETELQPAEQPPGRPRQKRESLEKEKALEKRSIIIFSILIMVTALVIVSLIYFTYFRRMDEELRRIERKYQIEPGG